MMMVAAFDASKATLQMSLGGKDSRLENSEGAIRQALGRLPQGCAVAVESTGKCHRLLADTAFGIGLTVYLLNPRKVRAYRKSEPCRGKTDRLDAGAMENYVMDKHERLHPYKPSDEFSEALRELTRRRETLTEAKVQALATLEDAPLLEAERRALKASFDKTLRSIDGKIAALLKQSGRARLLLEVPGFGTVVAAGLMGLLDRYDFKSADSFVAYVGLDPRPNDSGPKRGTRHLSCEGDSSVRRLLYNAAMAGCRCKAWKPYYAKQKDKGLSSTEALLILARKMARTAWSIHKHHAKFQPERLDKAT
jgi:transposase